MFCQNCGQENAQGTKFCGGCGKPMDQAGKQGISINFFYRLTLSAMCGLVCFKTILTLLFIMPKSRFYPRFTKFPPQNPVKIGQNRPNR